MTTWVWDGSRGIMVGSPASNRRDRVESCGGPCSRTDWILLPRSLAGRSFRPYPSADRRARGSRSGCLCWSRQTASGDHPRFRGPPYRHRCREDHSDDRLELEGDSSAWEVPPSLVPLDGRPRRCDFPLVLRPGGGDVAVHRLDVVPPPIWVTVTTTG